MSFEKPVAPHGSHANEAVIGQIYNGWSFNTTKRFRPIGVRFESLNDQEFSFFDKPDVEYSQAYENKKKGQDMVEIKNHDMVHYIILVVTLRITVF